jgi:hypothetical protein
MRPHNEGGCGPVCKGCLDEAHAAGKREGKREGIEAALEARKFMSCPCGDMIRALLQTEEKKT